MASIRFVTVVTLAAFLSAGLVQPALAGPPADPTPAPSPLRASIDRVAAQTVPQAIPARRSGDVRKQMMGGGGGGGGMMLMSLVLTAATLAGTYYMVKETKKSTDAAGQTR